MTNTRVNEIDLLRFIAALAVVIFHYTFCGFAVDAMTVMPYPLLAPISKYGYLGVELFFMISGFVILMSAASGNIKEFIISRLIRLFPAFWACCTITALFIFLIGSPRYHISLGQYLINMTMLSGFVDVPSVDGAYWSLFVEIKFYLLVTLVLLIKKIDQAQKILAIWLLVSVVLQLINISYHLSQFLIASYSAFFIAGGAFFLIWSKGFSIFRLFIIVVSWGLAVFQSVSGLTYTENIAHTEMNVFVVVGIVTAFFVVMFFISLKKTGQLGRLNFGVIGTLTYPLYLLHQNIGYIIFNVYYEKVNPHVLVWGTLLIMIVAAKMVHIFVEKRMAPLLKNVLNSHIYPRGFKKAANL